jgi:hypothetical protein
MGLDMRPMGKPKAGFEKRFKQIMKIIQGEEKQELSFFDKLKGKKIKNILTGEEFIWENSLNFNSKGAILLTTKLN